MIKSDLRNDNKVLGGSDEEGDCDSGTGQCQYIPTPTHAFPNKELNIVDRTALYNLHQDISQSQDKLLFAMHRTACAIK